MAITMTIAATVAYKPSPEELALLVDVDVVVAVVVVD
jgi:hypothetical protein